MHRAYALAQTSYSGRMAAIEQLRALEAKDPEPSQLPLHIKLILDGQRRLCEADSLYFRSLAEYARAIKEVHYHKGSLLEYDEVYLSEGAWPEKAYQDAADRERQKRAPLLTRGLKQPLTVSTGAAAPPSTFETDVPYPEPLPAGPPQP
jgi:hypothetical protein